MRIVQITDTHLSGPMDKELEVDPWKRMEVLFDNLSKEQADLLVHTGDICLHLPHQDIYKEYQKRLQALPCPVINLPGNHDDVQMMKDGLSSACLEWTQSEREGYTLIFLNTANGRVQKQDLQKLRGLTERSDRPLLIFMHHPPLYAGCMHMDQNYPLQNIEEVWPVLRKSKVAIEVYCGHYHIQRSIKVNNVQVNITPSPLFSIDPAFLTVKKGYDVEPVYRWIRIKDQKLDQGLSFIGGAIS